jgi:uncharacterized membrane protein
MGQEHANTRRPPPKDGVAESLGWFSLGLGAAQVAAPGSVCKLSGLCASGRNRALMRARGITEIATGLAILARPKPVGWLWSRVAGDTFDLAALAAATPAAPLRKWIAFASVTGVTTADVAEGARLSRSDVAADRAIRIRKAITVNRTPDEVYTHWRNFENLPRFMTHLESVQTLDDKRSRWRAKGPAGSTVEWEAEISEERSPERIAWRSLPRSTVTNSGAVHFEEAPGGRGTEVHVELSYEPPAGTLGASVAKLLGEEPATQLADDLRRFKQVVETGEVIRSEGSLGGHNLADHLRQRAAQPPTAEQARELVGGGAA